MSDDVSEYKRRFREFSHDYGKIFLVGILCIIFVIAGISIVDDIAPKQLRISFLDVSQGDAIFIQTPSGHDMLIDGGNSDRVLEKLGEKMSYFDRSINVIVATHPDQDHITGLIPVLKQFTVDHIVVSPKKGSTGIFEVLEKSISDEQANVHVGTKGDVIDFGDGVVAHIMYPSKKFHDASHETNDASVSILITYGNQSVLLTGDLPSTYEGELLQSILPKNVTVYKAGHHGSKYSSGEQLLSYIRPHYAVISAGKNNTYGHPNEEAVSRLTTYAKEVLSTIDHGTITFELDGKNVELETDK